MAGEGGEAVGGSAAGSRPQENKFRRRVFFFTGPSPTVWLLLKLNLFRTLAACPFAFFSFSFSFFHRRQVCVSHMRRRGRSFWFLNGFSQELGERPGPPPPPPLAPDSFHTPFQIFYRKCVVNQKKLLVGAGQILGEGGG